MSTQFVDDIHQKIHDFYEDSRDELTKNYPGIRLDIIKSAINDYLPLMAIKSPYLFDHYFVSHKNNPLQDFFEKLTAGVPLEYITGKAYFFNSAFEVNKHVLIPRSETEILVELAADHLKKYKGEEVPKILDVGTGSGVIIISLLQEVNTPVKAMASDVSRDALAVAKRNYFNLEYTIPKETELHFIESDRLEKINEKFHLIVSNPPYIKRNEDESLVHPQVFKYEPHLALFLNDENYDEWFKKFFKQIFEQLHNEGVFLMEGHEHHLTHLQSLAEDQGFINCKIIQDYTQRDRFLVVTKG